MAAPLRSTFGRLTRQANVVGRQFGTKASAGPYRVARPFLIGAVAAGAGIFLVNKQYGDHLSSAVNSTISPVQSVSAAALPESQPSVFSQGKDHALYLWIQLKPTANSKEISKTVAKLQKFVDQVSPPSSRDDEDEIWAGVGFGPNFFSQVTGRKTRQNYTYPYRKGALGDMPSSGGDIFIHAKSNEVSKLFELSQVILKNIPQESIENVEDIYSFVYKNGRDLSGFIDGTENPAADDDRQEVAVEKETGGSYVITQKWIHNMAVINSEKDKTMEGWLGRSRPDSIEQSRKSITSHVARMTGGSGFQQPKPVQIVRQSMPFGTLSNECGLFFIGYAASPANFEFMLDRMVGAGGDGLSDDVMRLSKNVKGTYWYFPGSAELKKME